MENIQKVPEEKILSIYDLKGAKYHRFKQKKDCMKKRNSVTKLDVNFDKEQKVLNIQ
jgi:hypothetical protein